MLGVTDVQSAEELHPVAFCPPFSSGSHGIAFCPSPDGLRAAEGFAAAANARAQLVWAEGREEATTGHLL